MKVSSRDILDLLRRYEMAGDDNVPRNIENIKISHTTATNTLISFIYMKKQFYVLFDDTANDDTEKIFSQIKTSQGIIGGVLTKNPKDISLTYAMPYKGKDCYLMEATSDKRRLDVVLAEKYPTNSRSVWQKYIKAGYVSVDGKQILSPKYEVKDSADIQITIPELPDYSKTELSIVYIDDNVIVIDKPAGILVHSKGALNDEFTVADFFRRYSSYNLDTNRPGIVHRLDRDTSGVMIGARNQETAILLQKQFADRKTKKTYFAIVDGVPKTDKAKIDLPIIRNPSAPSTFRVDSKGKSAITDYEVLASNGKVSLVKLQPTTGRTHQLRVHMKYLNTPIIGDRVYGKSAERLLLHAFSLEITIPNSDRRIFSVAPPSDFAKIFPDIELK